MTFTDDDLKRLKKLIPMIDIYGRWLTNGEEVTALLTRLEAAEALLVYLNIQNDYPEIRRLLKAWRKVCGK